MHDSVLMELKHFLSHEWHPGAPLLLACSGGPDSKALLHLLLESQTFFELEIQVAHIDHGWRVESRSEAQKLQNEVEDLGLSFHLRTLEGVPLKEESAREARYEQLIQIACETGAQSILLAHQMEDQAETVLKRVLEGATIPACGGMKRVSSHKGVALWRPLLGVAKKDLIKWLEKRNIPYFTDSTNLDARYLRGRLRTSIIPQLEASFGKSVVKNLCLLGERAQKIEEHLMRASQPLWEQKVADLKDCEEIVFEFFLKTWSRGQGLSLSRQELASLAKKLRTESPEKSLSEQLQNLGLV
jgi:tRNA(Ile)-lysidine synthase